MDFQGDQVPARGADRRQPAQAGAEIPGGVERVSGHDDVEVPGGEALPEGIGVEVEPAVLDEVVVGETALGRREERLRDVGEDVAGPVGGQDGEQPGGEPAGARPHLQDPQVPVVRPGGHQLPQQRAGDAVVEGAQRADVVELLDEVGAAVEEEGVHGVPRSAHHLRQGTEVAHEEHAGGELVLDGEQELAGRRARVPEVARAPCQAVAFEESLPLRHACQQEQESAEARQGSGREEVVERAGPAARDEAVDQLGGVFGDGSPQIAQPAGVDLVRQCCDDGVDLRSGRREEGRRGGGGRGSHGPVRQRGGAQDGDVLAEVVHGGRRHPPEADAVHRDPDGSLVVGEGDVPGDLPSGPGALTHVHPARRGRSLPHADAADRRGQVDRVGFGHQGCACLQGAVEEGREDDVAVVAGLGRDAGVTGQYLAPVETEVVQQPEGRAVVQAGSGEGVVELSRVPVFREALGECRGLQGRRRRGGGEAARAAAGVQAPGAGVTGAAGDPPDAVLVREGGLQSDVHRRIPGQGKPAGDVDGVQLDGGVEDLAAGGEGHLHVADGRHDHGPRDIVVTEPRGAGALHRGVPDRLQGGEALAQQGVDEHAVAAGAHPVLRGAVPVALPLPGVGRQVGHPAGGGEPRVGAGGPERVGGQQAGGRLPYARSLPEGSRVVLGGDRRDGEARAAGALGGEPVQGAPQGRPRPDLDGGGEPVVGQGADGVGEADRAAHVAPPVVGVQLARRHAASGDGRVHRDARCRGRRGVRGGVRKAVQGVPQPFLDAVHGGAVEGVVDVQLPEGDVAGGQRTAELAQRRRLPGNGDVTGAVDRRDLQPAGERGEGPFGLLLAEGDRRHAALAPGGGLGPAAGRDDAGGGGQVEGAADARGGELAAAVAQHGVRPDPVGVEHRDQAELEREQGGLRVEGVRHRPLGGLVALGCRAGEDVGDGPAEVGAQVGVGLLDRGAEDRLAGHQVGGHAVPLAAVAAEHERDRPLARGRRGGGAQGALVGGQFGEPLRRFPGRGGEHGEAVRVSGPAPRGGPADVVEVTGVDVDVVRARAVQAGGRRRRGAAQGLGRAGRDDQRQRPGGRGRGCGSRGRGGEDDVGVGAAEAEAVDADEARAGGVVRKRSRLGDGGEVEGGEVDGRVGRLGVEGGRYQAVPQDQHALEEPGDSGGRLAVPEVRLDRADRQGAAGASYAQGPPDGLALRRVPHRGARPVGLEVGHVVRGDPGPPVDLLQQAALHLDAGHREARGATVAVDAAGRDHHVDAVAVGQGGGQGLEEDDHGTLGPDVAVGLRRERRAPPARREHRGTREADERLRAQQEVDPADDRRGAAPGAQRLARLVQRDERGGARGVDRHAGPAQVEDARDPVGGQREGAAAHGVRSHLFEAGHLQSAVGHVRDPDEHRRVRTGQPRRVDGRVVERLRRQLQHQPLLRVQARGLARGHAEVRRVEAGDVGEVAAGERVTPAGALGVRVPEPCRVEAPLRRPRADHGAAVGQHLPQPLRVDDAAGQPARRPDNGDRVVRYRSRCPGMHHGTPRRGVAFSRQRYECPSSRRTYGVPHHPLR